MMWCSRTCAPQAIGKLDFRLEASVAVVRARPPVRAVVAAERFAAPAQEANMTTSPKSRRKARAPITAPDVPLATVSRSKLDALVALLSRSEGASLPELVAATGWQAHSVRGALAGALKRKGHDIRSEKTGGERRWRIAATS
jgi:hypothetical protein